MVSIFDSAGVTAQDCGGSISSARTDADYPRETTLYSLAGESSTGIPTLAPIAQPEQPQPNATLRAVHHGLHRSRCCRVTPTELFHPHPAQ